MRRRACLFGAVLTAATSILVASPAQAQEVCAGPPRNIYVCVDPFGTSNDVCVKVGDICLWFRVYTPTVECGGDFGEKICDAFAS